MSEESNEHRFPRVAGIENGYSIHTCSNKLGPDIEAGKTWNGQKITISFTLPEKPGGALSYLGAVPTNEARQPRAGLRLPNTAVDRYGGAHLR
jgi:hypothetical protein